MNILTTASAIAKIGCLCFAVGLVLGFFLAGDSRIDSPDSPSQATPSAAVGGALPRSIALAVGAAR